MRADVMLLARFGINMTVEEAGRRFIGKTFEAMLAEMTAEWGTVFPPGLSEEKDRLLEDLFRTDLKEVSGVPQILQSFAARGITFSVASNSPKARVELALQLTGIAHHFAAITTFEEVARGKPAPDVYLRAVEKSGHAADHCIVVEDSTTGVASGVSASLKTLGFTGTHHEPEEHAAKLKDLGALAVVIDIMDIARHL
jgi:HAD superfamily hydrolase (TIGR01509 family)